MEFRNKYSSELSDEDIIPFTTEALEVVETVVSLFCDCLNKNDPKFITLTNGNLSPKKEDINLHPSLDGDPTEKICQETTLNKNATVFQFKNDKNNPVTEDNNNENEINSNNDIQNTDKIINEIESDFNNKPKYDEYFVLSSDSEDEDDGAPACVLKAKREAKNATQKTVEKKEKDKKKEETENEDKSNSAISKTDPSSKDGNSSETNNTDNSKPSSSISKTKSNNLTVENPEVDDANSLDFPLDEIENHSNAKLNNQISENDENKELVEEEKKEDIEKEDKNTAEEKEEEEKEEDDPFKEPTDNFNDNDSLNDNFDNFEEDAFNKPMSSSQEAIEHEEENKNDNDNENEKEEQEEKEKKEEELKTLEKQITPTPLPNLEEMNSKFSSQISIDDAFLQNAQLLNDSNDEINFIPTQEKINSNCIRWKYHIKHHSTNKKLRCCNFLIYWSQPNKLNPVPKATAEMWMIYYHTSNIGRNDATITYRFNGYSNTHEINVHKFMKEYAKYKANPYVEITKKEFPTLYTPLVLNPKKWLPELIRSKLLISNDIMNKELLN